MSELDDLGSRLESCLMARLPSLAPMGSVDVHVDEIVVRVPGAMELVDVSVALFGWASSHLGAMLTDMVVMLLIPLRSSSVLVRASPSWIDVSRQLSVAPPSIYVMRPEAFIQADSAERYVSPMPVRVVGMQSFAADYHCWRMPEDDVEDGWARDVRSVFLGFLRERLDVAAVVRT